MKDDDDGVVLDERDPIRQAVQAELVLAHGMGCAPSADAVARRLVELGAEAWLALSTARELVPA